MCCLTGFLRLTALHSSYELLLESWWTPENVFLFCNPLGICSTNQLSTGTYWLKSALLNPRREHFLSPHNTTTREGRDLWSFMDHV